MRRSPVLITPAVEKREHPERPGGLADFGNANIEDPPYYGVMPVLRLGFRLARDE